MVPAGPADDRGSVGVAVAVRIRDETLLRHVQLPTQTPTGGAHEVLCVVFWGHGNVAHFLFLAPFDFGLLLRFSSGRSTLTSDLCFDGVFPALQIPDLLPNRPFAQAAFLVAEHGQERHRLAFDQFDHQFRNVEVWSASVERGHFHELDVATNLVGEMGAGGQLNGWPMARALQPGEQPRPQGAFLLLLPRLGVPAALVFGLLDERNITVAFDDGDATLHELAIRSGPMGGQFGDGRGTMAAEPNCLQLALRHLAGHNDFEGALAAPKLDLSELKR